MKISVCMATFQGAEFVLEQLTSILSQIGPHDEVLVIDDCSSDETLKIVRGVGDPRVFVRRNERNLGYSKNFERALTSATGDVVFIADQDDVWLPTKVATVLEALTRHDLVVHDVRVVDVELNTMEESHFKHHAVRTGFVRNFAKTRYIGAAMAMHRDVLQAALPFPHRAELCAYDYWIATLGEAFFDVGLIKEPLMLYRRHGSTASSGGYGSKNALAHKVAVRVYTFVCLLRRRARGSGFRTGGTPRRRGDRCRTS
jgi:glycosyltransferase involved in cell wall biosynthesis